MYDLTYPKEANDPQIVCSGSVPGQDESESERRGRCYDDWGSSSVADLCTSLTRRWEPCARFMILTAYFDESGTHDSSFSLMAGHVADARQWREYERQTNRLFHKNGVTKFHAIDVRRGRGCFKGWSVDRKIEFLDDYQNIINKTTEMAVFSIISEEDYGWYRCIERTDRKIIIESKYAILFRTVMSVMLFETPKVHRWRGLHNPSLYVVVEQGHPNCGDVNRFYNEACKSYPESKALKGLVFQPKDGNLPLAASDLLAYATFKDYSNAKDIGVLRRPSKAAASYRGTTYGRRIDRQDLLTLSKWKPFKP